MATTDIPVVGAPRKLAYRLLNMGSTDWIVLVIGLCSVYALNQTKVGFFGLVAGVALFVNLLYPLDEGRRYFVVAMNFYGRVWLGGVLKGVVKWEGKRTDLNRWRRVLVRLFVLPQPWPFAVYGLHYIGLLYITKNRSDSIIVAGDGSDFSRLTPTEQDAKLKKLDDSIKAMAGLKGLRARAGLLARRRPHDPLETEVQHLNHLLTDTHTPQMLVYLKQRGLPVTVASVKQLEDEGVVTDDELIDWNCYVIAQEGKAAATKRGQQPDLVAVLTVKRSKRLRAAARRWKKKLVQPKEVVTEDLVILAESFRTELIGMGVKNPLILNKEEVEDYVRAGWDTVELNEHRHNRVTGQKVDYRPTRIEAGTTYAKFNGTYHVTFRLTGLPGSIAPDDMSLLFSRLPSASYLSRALLSEVVVGTREYYGLGTVLSAVESISEALSFLRTGPKTERRREKLSNLQGTVDEQEHISYVNILLSLAHEDLAVIEKDVEEINRAVSRLNAKHKRVIGRAWTVPAAISAAVGVAL